MHKALRVAALAGGALFAQTHATGPRVLTLLSTVDDTDQPYALYLPRHFDPSVKYPLVIGLHAENSNHRLELRRLFGRGNRPQETDSEAANGPFPPFPDVDVIAASPLARGSLGYQGIPETDVYDVLEDVKKRFPIDENRIYLTGASVGGGGVLWLGLTRPDIWAAIAPVCPMAPPGIEELAPNALDLPVRIVQGGLDPLVLPASAQAWRDRFQEAGVKVEYTEYPGVRHNAWDYAYRGGSMFAWFLRYRRQQFPERVRFTTRSYKYRSAYWLELDGLTPGNLTSIDAKITGPNRVEVQTTGIDGFTLRLAGHPLYDPARAATLKIDGTGVYGGLRSGLSFSRTGQGWKAELYSRPEGAKGPGREGPIGEAISSRHLYVYGTADSPDDEELNRRRRQAEQAANWLRPPGRLLLSLRAVADTEVTESDLRSSNLVLFGTKSTNLLISRYSNRLPLALSPSAADYGLLFIASAGDKYVLVNSGLAWWTGASVARRPGAPQDALPFELLPTFGDFIVFKRSLNDVVAEGRFDRNWKVPADLAAKLTAAGVVQIR